MIIMVIEHKITDFNINQQENIKNALAKIEKNKYRSILVTDDGGVLVGVLTDGDIRRWFIAQTNVDFFTPVSNIMNRKFIFSYINASTARIQQIFSSEIAFVPLIDDGGKLVAVAFPKMTCLKIGDREIESGSPTFIIAEIGNNHNGNKDLAKKLIDLAVESGADCVKFQMRDLDMLYNNQGKTKDIKEDLGSQYTLDLLNRFNLPTEVMFELFDYCKQVGVLPLCTPWDLNSLAKLEKYGMPAYKVASADLTNDELLLALIKTGKPLMCSSGMTLETEIRHAVDLLQNNGAQFALLHCNSTYPAPFKDVNLNYLKSLKEISNGIVGYSGHERGWSVAIAAVALGAKIIEKHFTVDRAMEGNDHRVSLLPDEFKAMVTAIREVELSLGTGQKIELSQGEVINREILGKSLVPNCDIKKGDVILKEMLSAKSPGKGIPPYRWPEIVGKTARRDLKNGEVVYFADVDGGGEEYLQGFKFSRPWGLPVRYHDFRDTIADVKPDFVEFHFSYSDLDEDPARHFNENLSIDFVVHAPELFPNDHLLDLASLNENYRAQSVKYLQKVVDLTRKLKQYFKTEKPRIIVHVGGATISEPVTQATKDKMYELLIDSLSQINSDGVELVPETMPPLPWHFGGQRYHNLFINADEIIKFCNKTGYRICLDVAHSKLACNYYSYPFDEFVEKLLPHITHLHISDASGVDGEGLQIHEGEIDFVSLSQILKKVDLDASFIPEIWQGHKDSGRGFKKALEKLQKWI